MTGRRVVDFGSTANRYDRRHGAFLPDEYLEELLRVAEVSPPGRVLDVAAGTGRLAVPLARRGFHVVGLDRSAEMLGELARKDDRDQVGRVRGDAIEIPVASDSIDIVVLARLVYLVPEWRALLREVKRVLRPGGALLHEWSNGDSDESWVMIREKTRALFEEDGILDPFHPGARTEEEVDRFLREMGGRGELVVLGPGKIELSPAEFLRRIVDGEISYIWDVPEATRERCLPELECWVRDHFEEPERAEPFPREVRWTVWR